jgi:hypothetical protein
MGCKLEKSSPNREFLKITYWYSMSNTYSGSLKPQIEEGITDVVFKNKEEVKSLKFSKRHILKTITWRIIGSLDTLLLSKDPMPCLQYSGHLAVFS